PGHTAAALIQALGVHVDLLLSKNDRHNRALARPPLVLTLNGEAHGPVESKKRCGIGRRDHHVIKTNHAHRLETRQPAGHVAALTRRGGKRTKSSSSPFDLDFRALRSGSRVTRSLRRSAAATR